MIDFIEKRRYSIKHLILRHFSGPLFTAIILGIILYLGGTTYQEIGLGAISQLIVVAINGLSVALIIVLAQLTFRFIRHVLLDVLVAKALGSAVPRLLVQLSGLIVALIAIAAILGFVFKKDLTVLWAASGVAGFVFGMALKDMILDVFTGLALNLDRPIRIGDHVQILSTKGEPKIGQVLEINWRATRLLNEANNIVIIPNSQVGSATVINFSLPNPSLKMSIPLLLGNEVPPEQALRILEAAVIEGTDKFKIEGGKAPVVRTKKIATTGIEYEVYFYVAIEDKGIALDAVIQQIWKHLSYAGLKPFASEMNTEQLVAQQSGQNRQMVMMIALNPLFRNVPKDVLMQFVNAANMRNVTAGSVLVQAGEIACVMYLLMEGMILVESNSRGRNRGVITQMRGPGELIGGQATLLGDGYLETVRCRTTIRIAEFDLTSLGRILAINSELIITLSRNLAAMMAVAGTESIIGGLLTTDNELTEGVLAGIRRTFPSILNNS